MDKGVACYFWLFVFRFRFSVSFGFLFIIFVYVVGSGGICNGDYVVFILVG